MELKDRIVNLAAKSDAAQRAAKDLAAGKNLHLIGLTGTAKAVFLAAAAGLIPEKGPLVFLVEGREVMREYRQTLGTLYPDTVMQELYPAALPRVEADTAALEVKAGRTSALRILEGEEEGMVFITAEAMMQKQPRPASVAQRSLDVKTGAKIDQEDLARRLLDMGYERTDEVDALGQFTIRGEIMDLYPINRSLPVRIEWFDENIETMREFSLETRRSVKNIEKVHVVPLESEEGAIYDATVFDYLSPYARLVADEPARLFEMVARLYKEAGDYKDEIFTADEMREKLLARPFWGVSGIENGSLEDVEALSVFMRQGTVYNRSIPFLAEDLKNSLEGGVTPYLMLSSPSKARNLASSLRTMGLPALCLLDERENQKKINIGTGILFSGFRFTDEAWSLITENDIYGLKRKRRFKSPHKGARLQYFTDIKEGDYVVHDVHGIAVYEGVKGRITDGVRRDFLSLRYAGGDKLFVPVDLIGQIHKYVGSEGVAPHLSKMGGAEWKKTKEKASKAITALAEELLRLYAARKLTEGYAFSPDTDLQKEFEESFPYDETPDQIRAVAEIKADMEKPVPMDRLLCGDVGYGKTEVALRAAFKAVMDNKQVAVLAPTTVLAQQHLLTFKERMEPFGVRVAMVSRFVSRKEITANLEKLRDGMIDVIIGTHRLLQSDVIYHDLGLLVVDEEQRFGVAQKEKIKKWKQGIDVLTMSATPIPRTLHMSLVNGRDMSVIESPPEDRLPVETYVAEYSDEMVKEAIEREMRRGGRVYYVHNRVNGLYPIAERLERLVPGLSIRIAHGQMPEHELEDAMMAFFEGRCDVLLSTTIIENGLDVPMANTIIVEGAENFGLSQLYQMRGRVGRSSRLAYAYFVYRRDKVLSEVSAKRLQAVRDFTELGAGFHIAMRDLEIRGAGNLLGPQQHGYIAGVGFAAYCDMLDEAVRKLQMKSGGREIEPDPIVELPVNAYIPDDYVASAGFKLELYRRLLDLETKDGDELMDEIVDRFGPAPYEMELLWRVSKVRAVCRQVRIRGAAFRQGTLRLTFAADPYMDPSAFVRLAQKYAGQVIKLAEGEMQLAVKVSGSGEEALEWLEENLPSLVL